MNRRSFLKATTAIASVLLLPGWIHGAVTAPFGGNPNSRISSIDTSGGIASSRTSGQTPAFVQVSASNIIATGTIVTSPPIESVIAGAIINSYADLEYSWNFGDPTGTEFMYDPVRKINVNPNSDQVGPEAAYCYRSSGTYTITLRIRGKASGGYITASATMSFTVTDFNASGGTFYVDSVNGNDSNNGTTPSTPKATFAQMNASSFTNCHYRLAQGSHFRTSNGANQFFNGTFSGSHIRMDSYVGIGGAGADPIIEIDTAIANAPWRFWGTSGDLIDLVVSNIHSIVQAVGTVVADGFTTAGTHTTQDIYFDNLIFENWHPNQFRPVPAGTPWYGGAQFNAGNTAIGVGYWYTLGHQAYGNAGCQDSCCLSWWFKMGGTWTTPGTDQSDLFNKPRDHVLYDAAINHSLYGWMDFQVMPNAGYLSGALHVGVHSPGAVILGATGGEGTILTLGSPTTTTPGTTGTYNNVSLRLKTAISYASGSSGASAPKANVTVDGSGNVSTVTLVSGGFSYFAGDILDVLPASIGGTVFSIPVATINGNTNIDGATGILTIGPAGFSLNGTEFHVGELLNTEDWNGAYTGPKVAVTDNVTITSVITEGAPSTHVGAQYQLSSPFPASQVLSNFITYSIPPLATSYYCINGCRFQGADYAVGQWNLPGGIHPLNGVAFNGYVVQNCESVGLNGTISGGVVPKMTIRDCVSWGTLRDNGGDQGFGYFFGTSYKNPGGPLMDQRFYRNKIYGAIGFLTLDQDSSTPPACPLQFTDNIIWDDRTGDAGKGMVRLVTAQNAGSLIDRNQYWGPNYPGSGTQILVSMTTGQIGTLKTLTQWQAFGSNFDPNSIVAKPNWSDPANGNFNP